MFVKKNEKRRMQDFIFITCRLQTFSCFRIQLEQAGRSHHGAVPSRDNSGRDEIWFPAHQSHNHPRHEGPQDSARRVNNLQPSSQRFSHESWQSFK